MKESAHMKFQNRDDVIQLTPKWRGDRFDDGRPRVPDDVLRRISENTITEMWKPLYMRGYKFQYERALRRTNPDFPVMVGRAVTATFMPTRPDLHLYLLEYGRKVEGRKGNFNQWPIENLVKDDVLVYDMYDKIYKGCTLGGNLTNVIANKTGQGAITWGSIRDLEQILTIKHAQFYYRETDPTPYLEGMLTGINVPCKVGGAVCMPGDVVLGTQAGVLFIPPHLVEICAEAAEKSHVRDIWGFAQVKKMKYTASQMDTPWELAMWEEFHSWFLKDPEAEPYRHLDFSEELKEIRAGVIRREVEFQTVSDQEIRFYENADGTVEAKRIKDAL